jgi:ubiquitin-like 1-activating enzyme E1 A
MLAGDEDKIAEITSELCAVHNCDPKVFDKDLIKQIGSQADYQLSITCSIMGGMIADNIVRALTGREKPIVNCLVFDGLGGDGVGYVLKIGHVSEKETTEEQGSQMEE